MVLGLKLKSVPLPYPSKEINNEHVSFIVIALYVEWSRCVQGVSDEAFG